MKHVGAAKVRLASLDYHHKVDDANVKRLAALMRESTCDRSNKINHVTATIDKDVLDEALALSNLTLEELARGEVHGYPELSLPLGQTLQCLHGADRLAAAGKVLHSEEPFWVVDLYLAGKA